MATVDHLPAASPIFPGSCLPYLIIRPSRACLADVKEVIPVDPADVIKLIAAIAGVMASAKSALKYARRLGLI